MKLHWALVFCASFCSAIQPNQSHFDALKAHLKRFINQDTSRRIAVLVRATFHDLLYLPNGSVAQTGCLLSKAFQDQDANVNVAKLMVKLKNSVANRFPGIEFTPGDLITFAGKIALETSYPCLLIDWEYGRTACKINTPNKSIHRPGMNDELLSKFEPLLSASGLSQKETAILVAGTHGLKEASSNPESKNRWNFTMVNSGKQWIQDTFKKDWSFNTDLSQYINGSDPKKDISRLKSDMIYFPSLQLTDRQVDNNARDIERKFQQFASQDESVFNEAFKKAFQKLLRVGFAQSSLTPYVEVERCAKTSTSSRIIPSTSSTTYNARSSTTSSTTASTTPNQVYSSSSTTPNPVYSSSPSSTPTEECDVYYY